ncbi:MAG: hypothetical protein V2I97_19120 [Desulfococcaceae bacterium]|jgi:5-methylcytosine-specific restriction enzyme subunit McrC|nr:hypothetical protein [Desulfococcaceae bacterium]
MINLFEYQNRLECKDAFQGLESFLDDIWKKREKSGFYYNHKSDSSETQRFIRFIHKTKELKSNNYVGTIYFGGQRINLLPKIFYDPEREYSPEEIIAIHNHILWWLSYCRKVRFPNYKTFLGKHEDDFFEVLIRLFSKYTRELLSCSIYRQYEDINKELSFIRGRLDTGKYLSENIVKGRWHKINCAYDSFVFDNKFNQIIKYVSSFLFHITGNAENRKYLREILFILDEVSNVKVTAHECANIQFNPMFREFETVRDYCFLFLNNSISFDYKNDVKLFAFLLPMEYVFEDFIFGFIEKEIAEIKVSAQKTSAYLDLGKNYSLRPDLFLETDSKRMIADTKYKIIYSDAKDPKNGISQSDLYQMLAYAVRFGINEIILFYPDTIRDYQEKENRIIIRDELANGADINIKVFQVPVMNKDMFGQLVYEGITPGKNFDNTKAKLMERLKAIIIGK